MLYYTVRTRRGSAYASGVARRGLPLGKLDSGRNRFGSTRFGSGLFKKTSVQFSSVRKMICPGSTRFGLRFSDASWLGLVWFGSVPRPVPAGSRTERLGSVRFGRFGSASCSFLSAVSGRVLVRRRPSARASSPRSEESCQGSPRHL